MTNNLIDKTVLITGATGGIGKALCNSFATAKAHIILHYNSNKESLSSLGRPAESCTDLQLRPLRKCCIQKKRRLIFQNSDTGLLDNLNANNPKVWVEGQRYNSKIKSS